MKDLIARTSFSYGGKRLKKNDEFKARDGHAKVLVTIGKAALIAPRAMTTAPKATPVAGTYQNRAIVTSPRTRAPVAGKSVNQAPAPAQADSQESDA